MFMTDSTPNHTADQAGLGPSCATISYDNRRDQELDTAGLAGLSPDMSCFSRLRTI